MQDALSALREAIGPAQRVLEQSPLLQRLHSHDVTLADYRGYLQAQLAVFAAWSEAYPLSLRRACRCDPAAHLDALHLDLAALRDEVIEDVKGGLQAFEWPAESAAWFGALYVLESLRSTSRGVAQHLRQELGFCVGGALRFLDPANEASSQPAWSSLMLCLERSLPPERVPEAIEGALATYARLHAVFAAVTPSDPGTLAA